MNYTIFRVVAMIAASATIGSAQNKMTMSGRCGKADVQQSIPSGDQQGQMLMVSQGKCSVTHKLGDAMGKDGLYAEHAELTGDRLTNFGIFTETLDDGDQVFYKYEGNGTVQDGALQSGTNKWQITGGTGKMKGIKGSGNCKLTAVGNGSSDYVCTGTYTLAGSARTRQ